MSTLKKRGLGRGLEALLNNAHANAPDHAENHILQLSLDVLHASPFQPRQDFTPESLQDLAESIRAHGILQPILVRASTITNGDKHYEIIAGERRTRAARLAGLAEIPAIVRDLNDQTVLAAVLIENIQREDLSPLEEARGLQRLIADCGLTHQACAEAVGRSRAGVSNLLRLLDLTPDIQILLNNKTIEMGHARAILSLSAADQIRAGQYIVIKNWTVRQTENWVQRGAPDLAENSQNIHNNISNLNNKNLSKNLENYTEILKNKFGKNAKIQAKNDGGNIILKYKTPEELTKIMAILGE